LIVTIIDPAACSTVAVTVAAGAAVWCQWEETYWLTELQQLPWI